MNYRNHLATSERSTPLSEMAVGVGVSGLAIGAGVIVAAVLRVALAAGLWQAYFDLVMLAAERRLSRAKEGERWRLAHDSYSYLHLPMVAGIIFVALGVKQTLAHVRDPLAIVPAMALCGGVALNLLGHNAFRLREVGSVSVPRMVVMVLCCALIPVAVSVRPDIRSERHPRRCPGLRVLGSRRQEQLAAEAKLLRA